MEGKRIRNYEGKPVVAINRDGSWRRYRSMSLASKVTGVTPHQISQVCQLNKKRHVSFYRRTVNTDHHVQYVRYYYATDYVWIDKINRAWEPSTIQLNNEDRKKYYEDRDTRAAI